MSSLFAASDPVAYERVMGRWSRILAGEVLRFADLAPGCRVLDLGCGTGSLTRAAAGTVPEATVVGVDLAAPYVEFARSSIDDPRVSFEVADATSLPFDDRSFDAALSMLVLNFIPEHRSAAREMMRVTRPGGRLVAAIWDTRGGVVFSRMFWDTASALDPAGAAARARYMSAGLMLEGELSGLFAEIGLEHVEEADLPIRMRFQNFEDYWAPFLGRQGPPGAYVATLDDPARERLKAALFEAYCAGSPDGPRSFVAVARAVRGRKPAGS